MSAVLVFDKFSEVCNLIFIEVVNTFKVLIHLRYLLVTTELTGPRGQHKLNKITIKVFNRRHVFVTNVENSLTSLMLYMTKKTGGNYLYNFVTLYSHNLLSTDLPIRTCYTIPTASHRSLQPATTGSFIFLLFFPELICCRAAHVT